MADEPTGPSGVRFLVVLAALTIVIAGMKSATSVVLPVIVALFLTLICVPMVRRLRRLRIPESLAVTVVLVGLILTLLLLSGVLANSIAKFTGSVSEYSIGLQAEFDKFVTRIESLGVPLPKEELKKVLDTGAVLNLISGTMQGLLATLSNLVVILLIVAFMMFEAAGFPAKLRRAMGTPDSDLRQFSRVADQVWEYVEVKTGISLLTGVAVGVLVAIAGVDFPILWALVAFLFNFIPNVGSILAAIPACALALIQHGWTTAGILAAGYVAINMVVGNVIEPRVMGRRLGLSSVVVLLSLIFWNWVLGPVGMLLSVPLTMVVKIMMENSSDFRSVAILIGPAVPDDEEPEPTG
jgi:AI-2 transport protein TqsA